MPLRIRVGARHVGSGYLAACQAGQRKLLQFELLLKTTPLHGWAARLIHHPDNRLATVFLNQSGLGRGVSASTSSPDIHTVIHKGLSTGLSPSVESQRYITRSLEVSLSGPYSLRLEAPVLSLENNPAFLTPFDELKPETRANQQNLRQPPNLSIDASLVRSVSRET